MHGPLPKSSSQQEQLEAWRLAVPISTPTTLADPCAACEKTVEKVLIIGLSIAACRVGKCHKHCVIEEWLN